MRRLKSLFQQRIAKLIYRRGIGYEQRQAYTRAIAAFTQAIDKGYAPLAEAFVHRGINRIALKDIEGAIADFETVIQQEQIPGSASSYFVAQALFNRGKLYSQKGDNEKALAYWSTAVECCPTYAQSYYHRALLWIEKGDHNRALSDLDNAIEFEPSMAMAYFQRGNLRHQLGDIPGAAADWQYAICNDFTLEQAKQALGVLRHNHYQDRLSQVLAGPLAERSLTVKVQHTKRNGKSNCLDIYVHRKVGTGINYYTLPDLICQHLVPLYLLEIDSFRLISTVGEATKPDWEQSYSLYKGQPCPSSNWQSAISTIVLFPPLAIPALVLAVRVKRAYRAGKYIEALHASKVAKRFGIASSILFSLVMLLSVSHADYSKIKELTIFSNEASSVHAALLPILSKTYGGCGTC